MIRVLIVDDHAIVRSGLRHVLDAEEGIEVVGEAGDAQHAVFETRAQKPDVVLMDVVMPGKSGIEAIPEVLKDAPDAKILVLSMQDDPRYVREAFAAGAAGYILKEAADTDVVAAVREVAAGGHYVHPSLGARMVAADAEERKRAEADPLSDRERDVLRLLALGHTNQEIAAQLYISVRTAETHRAHIMQKLGLTTRAQLVRYAIGQGLLEDTSDYERRLSPPAPRWRPDKVKGRCCRPFTPAGIRLTSDGDWLRPCLRLRPVEERGSACSTKRTTDGEDQEPDPREQESDTDDDAEHRQPLSHVRRVECSRQRGRGDPDVPGCVVDWSLRLRIDDGVLVVVRRSRARDLRLRSRRERQVAAHLRVRVALGRLERVDSHVTGECTSAVAGVDRLACDGERRERDGRRQPGLLGLSLDRGRCHVRASDNLLDLDARAHRRIAVDADDDCGDTESDEHDSGGNSAPLQQLLHDDSSFVVVVVSDAQDGRTSRRCNHRRSSTYHLRESRTVVAAGARPAVGKRGLRIIRSRIGGAPEPAVTTFEQAGGMETHAPGREFVDVILREGATLRLRPPTRGDADGLVAFFAHLSPASLHSRFHGARSVSHSLVAHLLRERRLRCADRCCQRSGG